MVLVVVPSLASAQGADAPLERHGLFGGVGLFGGNISCDGSSCGDFSKGGGGAGYVGYMLSPRFGLLVDGWAMTAKESSSGFNVDLTFVAATLDARYYVVPALWVQGGVGSGHAIVSVGGFAARSDDVPAVLVAAGLEVVRGPSWALDVSLRLAQGSSSNSSSGSDNATTGRMVGIGADLTFFGRAPAR
jgi:hypothetical protein